MSSLLSILGNSASSLGAHRAASATASHNLENAATPGYARQRAELAATLPAEAVAGGWIGRGVTLAGVTQARSRFLEAQIPGARAAKAEASAGAEVLSALSIFDPQAEGSLAEALAGFYGGLEALSARPGDPSLRAAAVAGAKTLAQAFRRSAGAIEAARTGVDQQIQASLPEVQRRLDEIAHLNAEIRVASAQGAPPNDLLDRRLRLRDEVADAIGAVPVPTADGDLNLSLPDGTALVRGDRAATLEALPDPTGGGHLALRLIRTDGTGPVTGLEVGGQLGGWIQARDGALADAASDLDTLAWDLASAINTVHAAGFALDGSGGRPLFDVGASSAGAAAAMQVDAAVAADPSLLAAAGSASAGPGDGSNLLLLLDTEEQALSSGTDAVDTLATASARFGSAAARLSASAQMEGGILDRLEQDRASVSGVSIDEALLDLTKSQRAFEATMKVITTADEMLQTLLSLR